jgi:tetratricopeptide (TPR) repeat protein
MASDSDRLARLLGYLEADSLNPGLLTETVEAALAAGDLDMAAKVNERLLEVLPLGFEARYLAGLIAMRRGDFAEAARTFEPLFAEHDYPNLRFNLAWSRAMLDEKPAALALLDDKTVDVFAAAAMLKVQLVHEAGQFEDALALGQAALARHPDDPGLLAAMATLAIDVEDAELARRCAEQAGDHPEALAVCALLELQDGKSQAARQLFDRSLSQREHNPRAWIGRGLAALLEHAPVEAAHDIDRGAQQFGDHIGSWIAAGWAHFVSGDLAAAQRRFERALALDHNFAESQGSLAVLAVLQDDREEARRKAMTALRLDRECFSAALALAMLDESPERAREIIDRAMHTPINDSGLTLVSFMAGLSRPTLH